MSFKDFLFETQLAWFFVKQNVSEKILLKNKLPTSMLSLFSGPRSDHVTAVQLQGRPLEFGYDCLSMFDGKSTFPGSDTSSPQKLLREKRQPFTKVRSLSDMYLSKKKLP
jgi:hypothetical protein